MLLWACQQPTNSKLRAKWRGVHLENRSLDSFFRETQHYLDTFGKGNSDDVNYALYGVSNVDSLRQILRAQHDSTQMLQQMAVKNTIFHFMTDSQAMISFNGLLDTSKWYVVHNNELVLIEQTGPDRGLVTKMSILELTDNELKLRFEQENTFSTVTFRKETTQ
jgi:hypothetical protein